MAHTRRESSAVGLLGVEGQASLIHRRGDQIFDVVPLFRRNDDHDVVAISTVEPAESGDRLVQGLVEVEHVDVGEERTERRALGDSFAGIRVPSEKTRLPDLLAKLAGMADAAALVGLRIVRADSELLEGLLAVNPAKAGQAFVDGEVVGRESVPSDQIEPLLFEEGVIECVEELLKVEGEGNARPLVIDETKDLAGEVDVGAAAW